MVDSNYHRLYYYKRRQAIIDYLGGECVECGRKDDLQVDHIDPQQKSFNISRNVTLSNPAVRAELDKCQLLCRPHHEAKTADENTGFTHGSIYGWMTKKCTCAECTLAKWEWHDTRNAKRRKTLRGPYKTKRAMAV